MKPPVPLTLVFGHGVVVSAIGFDDKGGMLAEEVDDEGAERLLTTELRPFELPIAKQLPEASLRGRCGPTQGARSKRAAPKKSRHATRSAVDADKLRSS